MSGALKELRSKNVQDNFYTTNPQITFFRKYYKRHTNFASTILNIDFDGGLNFGSSGTIDFTKIEADLINKIYLKLTLNSVDPKGNNFAWVKKIGHAIINKITITCGGAEYDNSYGTWLDVWHELSGSINKEDGYKKIIGDIDILTNYDKNIKPEYTIYVPIIFWFSENTFSSFPLISSTNSPFQITVTLAQKNKLYIKDSGPNSNFDDSIIKISDAAIVGKFYYLDTDERKFFLNKPQEYLMNRLAFTGVEKADLSVKNYIISFQNPHRELIWCVKNGNYISGNKFFYYTNKDDWLSDIENAAIKLIKESIVFNEPTINEIGWVEIDSNIIYVSSININNLSNVKVWYNPTALGYNISKTQILWLNSKISADITINSINNITISNIVTNLNVFDLSVPIKFMIDNRKYANDPIVYQFNNYGLLIDGSVNPYINCGIFFDGNPRVGIQDGNYFSIIQPYEKHKKKPKTGICVYSFSLKPEEFQPYGVENFTKIRKIVLSVNYNTYDNLQILNSNNECWIFGRNISLLRFQNGRSGILNF